ncbi:FIST N-terminal domain-containing protein [Campylobacter jejuni]
MFFNFKNKSSTKKEESKKVLEALYLQENELEEKLKKINIKPKLIIGFASYQLNLAIIGNKIQNSINEQCDIILSSATDLLCNLDSNSNIENSPYKQNIQGISLMLFSEDMIENLCTNKIKLFSNIKDYTERKKLIEKEVLSINVPFEAHCINTLHYLIYDDLSQSESSLLELLYKHNPYPCALVGGGSSGNMDFSGTFIFYNGEILKNQALSLHIQFKPKISF